MEFCELVAFYNGKEEHDKFLEEIARKHQLVKEIYNAVEPSITEFDKNVGYEEIGDLIFKVKAVKIELINMSYCLQRKADELES